MASSGAIRAGRAFVEMLIDDATVKSSLDTVKAKLQAFGAVVDASATRSLSRMAATSTASAATTTGGVGLMAASMVVLRSTITGVGVAWRAVMGVIATSVIRATISLGALSLVVSRLAPKSKFAGLLNGFLSKSQTTEAVGRWTRFAGAITGSREIKNIGNQIQRLGLGSAIVSGFQKGVGSGLLATLGATYRSAKTVLIGGLASVLGSPIRAAGAVAGRVSGILTAPLRAMSSLFSGSRGAAGAGDSIVPALGGGTTKALSAPTAAIAQLGSSAGSVMSSISRAVSSVAVKFIGLAGAISVPAIVAAKSFAASAKEIMEASKQTGQSLQELIDKKFGASGLISPADIRAGVELSEAYARLKQATTTAFAQIGIAIIPTLQRGAEASATMANALSLILSKNRPLISSIVTTAISVLKAASAVFLLAKSWLVLAPIIATVISPIGLVAIAIGAIIYLFPQVRNAAISAFNYLFSGFKILSRIANETMSGIGDALSGGDLQAAARMLWAGLNLAWLTGSADLRAVWQTMVTSMANTFSGLWAALQKGWVNTTTFFMSIWKTTQNAIAGGIARIIAAMTGQDVGEVLATLTEMQDVDTRGQEAAAKKRIDDIEAERKARGDSNAEIDAAARKKAVDDLTAAQKEFAAAKDAAAKSRKNVAPAMSAAAAARSMMGTESMGTFSGAALGRQQIGGISSLQKATSDTAENTKKIAENTDPKNGLAFA
jgi:hypothetical protein